MGFEDLIGNKKIKKILSSYIKNSRIPFSMIFYGPVSANLTNFALSFAKAVNCSEFDGDYCDRCENCNEISKGIFPDVNIIYPEGQFYKKDQIMYLIDDDCKRPMKSDKKIYIITDASRMNENSSNAFLKVLEEPSPSTIFILLTNNFSILLPTIKSRCQALKFSPPLKTELGEYFTRMGYDAEKKELLSSLSQFGNVEISEANYYNFLQNRTEKFLILEKLLKNNKVEDVLLHLFDLSRTRSKFIDYFVELINLISLYLRDIIILKLGSEKDLIINTDFIEKLGVLKDYITVERLMFLIRRMEFILRDVKRNLNSKVLIHEFISSYV